MTHENLAKLEARLGPLGPGSLSKRAASLDEKAWQRKVQFLVEGKVMQEPPLGQFLWYLFFDAIHHRGQLSTYIRPMGGKVPSIYGPSGDDPGR